MSEYQYYEFCSISKPLSSETRKTMLALSSRSKVGTHNAAYVYNYGDFRGNPKQLLLNHFDVFFYISNWGTLWLMFKYPQATITADAIKQHSVKHVIEVEQHDKMTLLNLQLESEDGFGWLEGEGILADLLPLYSEIEEENYQALQLIRAIDDKLKDRNTILDSMLKDIQPSPAQQTLLKAMEMSCEHTWSG